MRIRVILLLISAFLAQTVAQAQKSSSNLGLHTVVIDPGHGGKDPGGVSKDRRTFEKNVALDISKRLGKMIDEAYPDVNVYYTRTTDVFIPLQKRADIANDRKADLFISVHINATSRTTPSGHSVHILGESSIPGNDLVDGNLNVCKRENSVIMLEDDYKTTYQGFDPDDDASYIFMSLMQGAYYEQSILFASLVEDELTKGPIKVKRGVSQDPFYVLWKTAMPSVLLELGFITNEADLSLMRTEKGRNDIAKRVFDAFKIYKKNYDDSMKIAAGNN